MKIIMRDLQCDCTSTLFPRPCNFTYQQKRTDSPLLRFTIHLDSQADCDDSTQLNVSFSGCSKETRFPIPNYIRIVANNSSMILSELWQTGADSTQLNSWDSFVKCCKYIPFAHLPDLLPTYLANQLQSRQLIISCCWHFKESHGLMRWDK